MLSDDLAQIGAWLLDREARGKPLTAAELRTVGMQVGDLAEEAGRMEELMPGLAGTVRTARDPAARLRRRLRSAPSIAELRERLDAERTPGPNVVDIRRAAERRLARRTDPFNTGEPDAS